MARYMSDLEREALAEFNKELEDSLKEFKEIWLRKKVNKKVDSH